MKIIRAFIGLAGVALLFIIGLPLWGLAQLLEGLARVARFGANLIGDAMAGTIKYVMGRDLRQEEIDEGRRKRAAAIEERERAAREFRYWRGVLNEQEKSDETDTQAD